MLMDVKMFRMELVLEAKDSGMMLVIMTATLGEVAGKWIFLRATNSPVFWWVDPSRQSHLRGRDPADQSSK